MITQSYSIRLRERGQITLPWPVREQLGTPIGDVFTLVQAGEMFFITPKQVRTPALIDAFIVEMENENVSLADLLTGLRQEREAAG